MDQSGIARAVAACARSDGRRECRWPPWPTPRNLGVEWRAARVIIGGGKIGTFVVNPGNNGGRGSSGNTGGGSGGRVSGGDKNSGDKDRPHKPRWPKHPVIIVGTPPVITVATTPALGVVNPQLNQGGGGGTGPQLLRRPGGWELPADEHAM